MKVIGFLFWQDREGKFDNALEESLAEAVEKALSALEHSHSAASTEIYAVIQVLCGLAYYHLLRNRVPDAEKYVNKAISALCKADLQATIEAVRGAFPEHSVLSSGIFLEARSPAEEHVAAIAQIVFLDNTVALIAERDTLVAVEYVTALSSLRVSITYPLFTPQSHSKDVLDSLAGCLEVKSCSTQS